MQSAKIKALLKVAKKKYMSPEQYLRFMKRKAPDIDWDAQKILDLPAGFCPGGYIDKNGKMFAVIIRRIYFKTFNMTYSTHTKDRHIGKEILISSFPLPRGPVIKHATEK